MKRLTKFLEIALLGAIVMFGLLAAVMVIRLTPLWSSEASGWAQAIGAVQDGRRLDELTRRANQNQMVEAVVAIIDVGNRRLYHLIKRFEWNRATFSDLAEHRWKYDIHGISEVRAEYSTIPIHENWQCARD